MKTTASMKVSTRILILIGMALAGLLVMSLISLGSLRSNLLEDRKEKVRNLVEVAIGILEHHHKLAESGKMSQDEARNAAREVLRGLRYSGTDYFFAFNSKGIYFLHPSKPEWEGTDKLNTQDSKGKHHIQAMIATAQQGGGYVDYWYARPGQEESVPKLSYVALFKPWDVVLGTGIYIDDIDQAFRKGALELGGVALGLLIALLVVGHMIRTSIVRQLGGEPAVAAEIMRQVAAGDLTGSCNNAPPGSLLHSLDGMVASLRTMVSDITHEAKSISSNAQNISAASTEVAHAALQQSEATSAMAAAIEELTVSSNYISDNARDTAQYSEEAVTISGRGTEQVRQATAAIERIATTVSHTSDRIRELDERANQISSITGVIKDIAGQTNLLALNAAIEAARAGESGRGFAVVADEVRKLAERTSGATLEIEQMISGIQGDTVNAVTAMSSALPEVQRGVELSASVGESLQSIENGARQTLERVSAVATSTQEQTATSTTIAQRVEEIAHMVEDTSRISSDNASSARTLEASASALEQIVSRFRV
jgi:methyl-accepting chemotaxis protein